MKRISVCVPTRNRGATALGNVRTMRETLPSNVQIVVLDNDSFAGTEGYEELSRMPDVKYVRHEHDLGFHGNFVAAFDHADNDVVIFCSDEDVVPPEAMDGLKRVDWALTSTVRGSVVPMSGQQRRNSYDCSDMRLPAGRDAMVGYGFNNSYLSGTTYNTALLQRPLELLRENIEKQRIYPHLYLDLLAASVGDVITIHAPTACEGPSVRGADPNQFDGTYGLGARLDQHIALRDAVFDAVDLCGWNPLIFGETYLKLCERTYRFVTRVNAPQHRAAGIETNAAVIAAWAIASGCVVTYERLAPIMDSLQEEIRRVFGIS